MLQLFAVNRSKIRCLQKAEKIRPQTINSKLRKSLSSYDDFLFDCKCSCKHCLSEYFHHWNQTNGFSSLAYWKLLLQVSRWNTKRYVYEWKWWLMVGTVGVGVVGNQLCNWPWTCRTGRCQLGGRGCGTAVRLGSAAWNKQTCFQRDELLQHVTSCIKEAI